MADKKKKEHPFDPFEGMHMVGVFGLPLARYAYDNAGVDDKKKKNDYDGLI